MRKLLLLTFLLISETVVLAQNGNHQPFANYWFPSTILSWSPASDPSAKFNRGVVPLATRFSDTAATTCGTAKPKGLKLAALTITNANTSGNPSQGYDHAGEYAFGYWQYLDYFVMWGGSAGEGLILAPNATWIDAGHRNGVKVMGTIFLPPTAYGGQLQWVNDLVQTGPGGNYPVADKLIEVANYYGFDGWFINQETAGGNGVLGEKVIAFMKYFQRHKTGNMEIMWYDAMLPSGAVGWQRELNSSNVRMFQDVDTLVSQTMFLDFAWTATKLANSKTMAQSINRNPMDLFAGVDVQSNGYNTAVPWSSIFPTQTNPNTSVGLYVPSWTFHNSPDKNDIPLFYQREQTFWMGANNHPCQAPASGWPGLAKYYIEKSAVNTLPFLTRFNTGQSTNGCWIGGQQLSTRPWNNMSAQEFLPTWRWLRESNGTPLAVDWDFTDAYNGGNSLKISGALNTTDSTLVRLYNTKLLLAAGNENLSITYKLPAAGATNMKVAITFTDAPNTLVYFDCGSATSANWETKTFNLSSHQGRTISMIGLRFMGTAVVSNYKINIGALGVLGAGSASAAATGVAIEPFIACDNAELKVTYTASVASDVWYYDIYRILPGNVRQWLGRTPNTAFYVKNLKRSGMEAATTIAVVVVNKSGIESATATQSFAWPTGGTTPANYSINLNGSSKYVDAGLVTLSGANVSLEGWIYARTFKSASPFISSMMGIEDGNNTAMIRLGDASVPNNKVQFILNIGGSARKLTSAAALNANTWYHIAGTYDGTTMRLYINGAQDATLAVGGTVSASGNFFIGRNSDNGRILDGYVDEVRAWKRTLSATEIAANNCSVSPAATSLEGYWNFNDCAGLVIDQTTHGHDGAAQGMSAADWTTQTPCQQTNGVPGVSLPDEVQLYPNPVAREAGFTLRRHTTEAAMLSLYDIAGALVLEARLDRMEQTINTSNLNAGMYLYKITGKQGNTIGKVTVK